MMNYLTFLMGKNSSFKEVEKFYKEHRPRFIEHKTKGLVKICVKEYVYNKLLSVLKVYKKIKIDKLSITAEIEKDQLIPHLKNMVLRNKINLRYDEISGIVEILNENFEENQVIEVLKTMYKNMNSLQIEMVDFAFQKNFRLLRKIQNALRKNINLESGSLLEMDEDN